LHRAFPSSQSSLSLLDELLEGRDPIRPAGLQDRSDAGADRL
jgi:hypothetical protein